MSSSSSRAPWSARRPGRDPLDKDTDESRYQSVSPGSPENRHAGFSSFGDQNTPDGERDDQGLRSEPAEENTFVAANNKPDPALPPEIAKRLAMAESRANKAERLAQGNADKLMNMIERVKTMAEARRVPQRSEGAVIPGESRAEELRVPLPKRYNRASGIDVVPGANVRRRRGGGAFSFLWFVIMVLLPIALASVYYFRYASDQYASGTQFFVRGGEANTSDSFGKLTGFGKAGGISTFVDAQIVAEYIKSRQIVEDLLPTIDLRKMYAREDADWYVRLKDDASIEELTGYWNGMVTVTADITSGIVGFEVRALTAEDAEKIASGVLAASEKLVNDLSRRARDDAVRSARADVDRAEKKLRDSRAELRKLRDTGRILDARGAVESNTRLVGELEANVAKLNADLSERSAYLAPTAPTIVSLKNQIASLKQEIARVKASVVAAEPGDSANSGSAGQPANADGQLGPFTSVLTNFEENYTEIQIDEFSYKNALEYLQHARAQADQQQAYLSVIVKPTLPQIATYPERIRNIVTVALVSILLWVLGLLLAHSVRDHML